EEEKVITLGNELHHTVTVQTFKVEPHVTLVKSDESNEVNVYQADELVGTLTDGNQLALKCRDQSIYIQYESQTYEENMYYIGKLIEILFPHDQRKVFSMINHQVQLLI